MSLLLLDHGNSRLKWCVLRRDGGQEFGVALAGHQLSQLEDIWRPLLPLRGALGVSVGQAVERGQIEAGCRSLGIALRWEHASAAGADVANGYQDSTQLGADRWMALVAARQRHRGAGVVVMAGTATTVDSLDPGGCFVGGMILPGLDMMRASLTRHTARLPAVSVGRFDVQARSTQDAIYSGTLAATLGAIGMARERLGHGVMVLLGGGGHGQLAPYLSEPLQVCPELVLEGLACWAVRNPDAA